MKDMRSIMIFVFVFFSMSFHSFAQSAIDHWEMLVLANDTWSYFPGTSEPPGNWNTVGFDDGSWQKGPGGIGYGDDDDGTIISPVSSVYLRIIFNINDLSVIVKAILLADYDDGYVAYLNGNEVARSGMSGTPPTHNQFANQQHEALMYRGLYPEEIIMTKNELENYLMTGENVLAVQVHNADVNSSNLSSNFYLMAGLNVSEQIYRPVPSWFTAPLSFDSSNLPLVKINTGGISIPDEPKISAAMGIIDNGSGNINYVNDPFNEYDGNIAIEIRGSSSQMFPKKQYGFKLRTFANQDTSVSLLGLPAEEDWILYAPYSDKSLLRNVLAYKFGEDLGWYAPRTKLVELYLNEQYQGVYVLTEKIKRDKNRVDISKLNPDENSGDDLTGGYIIKIDKAGGAASGLGWNSPFRPPNATQQNQVIHFQYHYPKDDRISIQQQQYIQNYVSDFENALTGPDWKHPKFGYRNFINVESFIDYAIVNEISRNVDGYRLSTFLYKDKNSEDGKLHIGPVWDYNLAFGNADYCDGSRISGWAWDFNHVCNGDFWLVPFWWERFLSDPEFILQFKSRWTDLRSGILSNQTIMHYIDSVVVELDDAQKRNFTRWPVLDLYVWPNNYVGGSYTNEIQYLKNWISDRLNWMDNSINAMQIITGGIPPTATTPQITLFPNPNDGDFSLRLHQDSSPKIQISIMNQLGELIYDKNLKFNRLNNIISSDLELKSVLNRGIYIVKITENSGRSHTEKMIVY